MLGGILILVITSMASFAIINSMKGKVKRNNPSLLKGIFFMHLAMTILYYVYSQFNASDSHFYYEKVMINYRGPDWGAFYGVSTTFVEFIGYPFIRFMGFSYEAIMVLFSFAGFVGFVYFYRFFKENVRFQHKLFNFDLISIILLLPNLHFWSASFGKGSVIFMGIAMFFFAVTKPKERWLTLLIGAAIVYHIRPHIMFVILASALVGFTFTTKGLSISTRIAMVIVALLGFAFIYQDVLAIVGIEQGEELDQGLDLTHRARELTKAGTGVDITQYGLGMKLFTFLYRPLLVDAPGLMGVFVSIENIFYLILTLKILNLRGIRFLFTSDFLVKMCFFSFLTASIALAQVSANLGLAIRQKSQVMILFLYVIVAFLDENKFKEWKLMMTRKRQRMRFKKLEKERVSARAS